MNPAAAVPDEAENSDLKGAAMKTAHKQVLALVLALILLLSLCACAQKTQTESDEPKMSTNKVDLLTKADKKTPERQPEEAISQSDMSNRTSRNETVDMLFPVGP